MPVSFQIQTALLNNSAEIIQWPLSTLLLKNEDNYRWFLLVPRKESVSEITALTIEEQFQLMREINTLSNFIQATFKTDKINIASIGNKVPQLHVHVVGRFETDPLWPESIWQAKYAPMLSSEAEFTVQAEKIRQAIKDLS